MNSLSLERLQNFFMKMPQRRWSRLRSQRLKKRMTGSGELRPESQCSTWTLSRMSSGREDHGCSQIDPARYPRSREFVSIGVLAALQMHIKNTVVLNFRTPMLMLWYHSFPRFFFFAFSGASSDGFCSASRTSFFSRFRSFRCSLISGSFTLRSSTSSASGPDSRAC